MIQARKHIITPIVAALAFACLSVPAHAATRGADIVLPPSFSVTAAHRADEPVRFVQNAISPSKAKSIARRAVPGAEVVDISRKGSRYKVRMIRKDGRVVDIVIDATSGRVLN